MSAIREKRVGNTVFLYDTAFFSDCGNEQFNASYWQSLDAVTGHESGRGTTWFIQDRGFHLVLRHYLRGGWVSRFNHDRYLFTGWQACRSLAEMRILAQAHALGLPVPRPAAAMAERHGLSYRASILLQRIEDARDLVSLLQSPQNPNFYLDLGGTIAQFHRQGVLHADLNIKNILQDRSGQFWLIDFDRAQLLDALSPQQERRVLERLQRSFIKESMRSQVQWNPSDWEALLKGYARGMAKR